MLPLLFIDFETTGLDPFVDEIVQVAYLRISHEDVMKGRFALDEIQSIYVMPLNPQRAFIKTNGGVCAADINGFNIEKWEKQSARRWVDTTLMLHSQISGARWIGMNPCFDYQFYTTLCNRHHVSSSRPGTYHICDITSMAYNLLIGEFVENLRLDTIAKYFNLERQEKYHSAAEDVYLTAKLYKQLNL